MSGGSALGVLGGLGALITLIAGAIVGLLHRRAEKLSASLPSIGIQDTNNRREG